MWVMIRASVVGLLGCVLAGLAQNPAELFEKAPPSVDEALRARISKFYQAHVDGKFRLADEVVAEDSKDAFFEANKTRCYTFEIVKINYSESFTRATAVVTCEMDFVMPGAGKLRVKAPRVTLWKLAGGQWWWHIVPTDTYDSPFGKMHPGPEGKASAPVNPQAGPSLAAIMSMVKASKSEVRLSSDKPGSDEVILTSTMPGTVSLVLQYASMPGLDIQLDRKELKTGETARVSARWAPKDKVPPPSLMAQILVQPTGQVVSIRVSFAPPGK
jgi:hypothetical protein